MRRAAKYFFYYPMTARHFSIIFASLLASLLVACQESLEDKAAREAAEYTRKYCPTPVVNYIRTDSVSFNKQSRTYTYYCSFADLLDNEKVVADNRALIMRTLTASVKASTIMKPYVQAGFHFLYVCRSAKDPKVVYLQTKI